MLPDEGTEKDLSGLLDDSSICLKMTTRYYDVEGNELRTSTLVGGGAKNPFITEES